MDDSTLSALKASFDTATSWDEWATAVVVAGVVIEFLALLIFSKQMSRAEKAMLIAGSLLVAVGVGGEYVFGSRASHIAAELQQRSDETVAGLKAQQETDHKIATQAAAHAADLGVSIDNLHKFVDDEKKQNDDVINELKRDETRLATARDEAQKASAASRDVLTQMNNALNAERAVREQMIAEITPRTLQQEPIQSALSSFAPTQVDIFTFGDTREITDFGRILVETLAAAGWKPRIWAEMNGASAGVRGVPIFVRPGADAKVTDAANSLARALQAQQIVADVLPSEGGAFNGTSAPGNVMGPVWDQKNVADLRVFIGSK